MFHMNKNQELDTILLQKMIVKFNTSIKPHLLTYKDNYNGIQAILRKSYSDESKPCSHIITNYLKNIADAYCGYIASPGYISYQSDNDIEDVMDVLNYNDYQEEDCAFLLDALIYGVANELMYVDADSKTRFRLINPTMSFGVFDDSLSSDLLYFVRMYRQDEWNDNESFYVDVYSDFSIKHYTMVGLGGGLTFVDEEPHFFNQCPANIFYLQDEKAIFDCVMSLQDGYNEILCSEVDDYSAFCDAYLELIGVDADEDDIKSMKENRVMVLPEGASANWLTKNGSDTQVENLLKRINDNIYRIAQCPDFSSDSFVGGVSSGIAIRYRLTGMETRASHIEALMKKALQHRIELICGIASLRLGEEVFRDIQITFNRNIPSDNTDIINIVNALKGTVSDATLLSMIPQIDDVDEEMARLQEQKANNMAMYNFGFAAEEEDDELLDKED